MLMRDLPDTADPHASGYTISLPAGPQGLDIGLAILDLLEDRFGAELVDFHLGDGGGYFSVKFPRAEGSAPPRPAA